MHKLFDDDNFPVMKNVHKTYITKFGRGINIKSIQENESLVRCFGWLISCCSLNWEVMSTIFEPSCYASSI